MLKLKSLKSVVIMDYYYYYYYYYYIHVDYYIAIT